MANAVAPFESWFYSVPPITRGYMTGAVLTTIACQLNFVSALKLYFDFQLIVEKAQLWRLITNFFFFGNFGVDFVFHMFFLVRYSGMLEEGYFRNRPADYIFMLLFGAALMLALAPFIAMYFLGTALMFMMVYVWARKNPQIQMNFMGVFNFKAPWLPWVLLVFSLLLNNSFPVVDMLGIAVGHVYFYLEDIYPKITRGQQILRTPHFLTRLFQTRDFDDPTLDGFAPEVQAAAATSARVVPNGDVGNMEDETAPLNPSQNDASSSADSGAVATQDTNE